MKTQRISNTMKTAGKAIATFSNASDKTDSSEKPAPVLGGTKLFKDTEVSDLTAQLQHMEYTQTSEEQVPLKVTDTDMQSEFDTVFSFDTIMTNDDQNLHSKVVSDYGREIIANLKKNEFTMKGDLDRHEIKSNHRKQMVVWMEEVLRIFKCPVETFFMAVHLMDRYFESTTENLKLDDLHEIGITSMFIASKYLEVEPLTLDLMISKVAHGKLNAKSLKKREVKIVNVLKFKLTKPNICDFIESYIELFSSKFDSDDDKTSIREIALNVAKSGVSDRKIAFTVLPSEAALCSLIIAIKDYAKQEGKTILTSEFSRDIKQELASDESTVLQIGKRLRKLSI